MLLIWEAGNIIILDMLRAAKKSKGLSLVFGIIEDAAEQSESYGALLNEQLSEVKAVWRSIQEIDDRDQVEATAKPLFKQLIRLFQMSLLIEERESANSSRFDIALKYFAQTFVSSLRTRKPLELGQIQELLGWEY